MENGLFNDIYYIYSYFEKKQSLSIYSKRVYMF